MGATHIPPDALSPGGCALLSPTLLSSGIQRATPDAVAFLYGCEHPQISKLIDFHIQRAALDDAKIRELSHLERALAALLPVLAGAVFGNALQTLIHPNSLAIIEMRPAFCHALDGTPHALEQIGPQYRTIRMERGAQTTLKRIAHRGYAATARLSKVP